MEVGVLLFENFETLDVFGPVEIIGRLKDLYTITFYSLSGGLVRNSHGISILTEKLKPGHNDPEIFIIPGGAGTRNEVNNIALIKAIKEVAISSKYVLTICTGSTLLARTGLLDNRNATSDKRVFDWVRGFGKNVNWIKQARWTVDGKYYTSSGVSAGMDMALGFLSDQHGLEFARKAAFEIEYNWTEEKENDNFSDQP